MKILQKKTNKRPKKMNIFKAVSKKAIYISLFYELTKIIMEFRKRNAKKIKLELHKSTGQAFLYFDDSMYKGIGSGMVADIFSFAYTTLFNRKSGASEVSEEEVSESAKKSLKLDLLPLPKEQVLCYSYTRKPGDIVELAFFVKDNNMDSFVKEELESLNNILNQNKKLYYIETIKIPTEVEESDTVKEEVSEEEKHITYEIVSINVGHKKIFVERNSELKAIMVDEVVKTKKDAKVFFKESFKVED